MTRRKSSGSVSGHVSDRKPVPSFVRLGMDMPRLLEAGCARLSRGVPNPVVAAMQAGLRRGEEYVPTH